MWAIESRSSSFGLAIERIGSVSSRTSDWVLRLSKSVPNGTLRIRCNLFDDNKAGVEVGQLWWDASQKMFVIVFALDERPPDCPWMVWAVRRFYPGDTDMDADGKRIYLTGGIFEHPYMRRIA